MLDERKGVILRAVVEEYVATGNPVGSAAVAKAAQLKVSSATVRNEMMVLEAQGYIDQPHTSAGRVPTDLGYRYYIDHLARPVRLAARDRAAVVEFFSHAHRELENMLAESSRLLSRLTAYAAVVVGPQLEASRVRDVHLTALSSATVLAVLVLDTGRVEKLLVEGVSADHETVARAAHALAEAMRGSSPFGGVPPAPSTGTPEADSLAARVVSEIARWAQPSLIPFYLGGTSNLMAGVAEAAEVQHVLDALEEQVAVMSMLSDALHSTHLVVRIGSENTLPEMKDWSVVTARYQAGGRPLGAVSVVGPTRMNYLRAMSAVEAVSEGLGDALGSMGAE